MMRNLLTVALGILLVILILNALPGWVTDTEQSLLLIGFVLLLLLFTWGEDSRQSLSKGSFLMQVISFVLVLGALDAALYEILPTAPLFNTPEGYGHLAAYFVLAFIGVVVASNNEGFRKFSLLVMLGVVCALIGPRTAMLLPGLGEKLHLTGLSYSASNVPNICTGTKKTVEFGATPVDINPGGTCGAPLWHEGHCLYLKRAEWTNDKKIYGPHCGGLPPDDLEWAWSADIPFVGAVALIAPQYH